MYIKNNTVALRYRRESFGFLISAYLKLLETPKTAKKNLKVSFRTFV